MIYIGRGECYHMQIAETYEEFQDTAGAPEKESACVIELAQARDHAEEIRLLMELDRAEACGKKPVTPFQQK